MSVNYQSVLMKQIRDARRKGERLIEHRATMAQLIETVGLEKLKPSENETSIILIVYTGGHGPFPRSELRRLFDAGYLIEPSSYKKKVNGKIVADPTPLFWEHMSILEKFVSI